MQLVDRFEGLRATPAELSVLRCLALAIDLACPTATPEESKTAHVPLADICDFTRLSRTTVKRACDSLKIRGILGVTPVVSPNGRMCASRFEILI